MKIYHDGKEISTVEKELEKMLEIKQDIKEAYGVE